MPPGPGGAGAVCEHEKTNVILGTEYHTLWGQDWLEETLCGHTFQLSVPSFFQINRTQTEVLYNRVMEFAALTGTETVVDLYCGIGTISLTLAEQAGQVIGVEVVPQAVAVLGKTRCATGLQTEPGLSAATPPTWPPSWRKRGSVPMWWW